ncbi:hypothetical protein [Lysinibacillus parviboronicapiens]|uniref:hypothetical protein n=1 Tax=Lysinibacillus parviboronicapiens TaxID=436516 RepID=UPI000D3CCD9A|nr:hypothetical protein [Lysinibacillus parviboronicapiens]
MSITIKIHNTDIERELTDPTEIWFYEKCKKQAEEDGQVFRAHLSKHGTIYYTSGELNIDRAARLIYEILKEQGKI